MLADVFTYLLQALAYQGIFVVAWVAIALTHILSSRYNRLFGGVLEYRSDRIPAFNPCGLGAWFLAAALGRVSEPRGLLLQLDDYRRRYAQYRSDPDLQALHAALPFIVVWDDHELHNDWDTSVFTDEPGRFEAASRAWFEYQPVWPTDGTRIHRSFRWGRLGELFVLDSRQHRTPSIGVSQVPPTFHAQIVPDVL